ncbi:MAG TPA: 50S ribosomal protein L11 methyltransferase [Solirubrobacteraceae bacterium]|nr:50S ribosomal protein L11 methyltransferase [Solirubrobacteraceae bacterium]
MIRLAVRVVAADAEIVLAELLELAPGGVEEVELDGGVVEYAVYGSSGELPDLPEVRAAAGSALVEVSSSEIAEDWDERWKRFHRPVQIDSPAPGRVPSVRVRPPWEPPGGHEQTVEVVVDPGQAFGTGGHATTRLCVELLLGLAAAEQSRGPLLDVGTGSGVLAITAAKLGYTPVVGFDHDRESVRAAALNASVNGVDIDIRRLDLRVSPIPTPDDDLTLPTVLVANLLRPLLLELASAISAPPAHMLAGGLLKGEVDEIARVYAERLGMHERERRESDDWAALWLQAD